MVQETALLSLSSCTLPMLQITGSHAFKQAWIKNPCITQNVKNQHSSLEELISSQFQHDYVWFRQLKFLLLKSYLTSQEQEVCSDISSSNPLSGFSAIAVETGASLPKVS